jgi:hypothetical protein
MKDREQLIEEAAAAFRPRDPLSGRARAHPSWLDLDGDGRQEAHRRALVNRTLEAALASDGLSTTGAAVLRRIRATAGR